MGYDDVPNVHRNRRGQIIGYPIDWVAEKLGKTEHGIQAAGQPRIQGDPLLTVYTHGGQSFVTAGDFNKLIKRPDLRKQI